MAVIEYKENEHGGGFVGFRVARTIGRQDEYRQKYFSIQKYGRRTASKLANELNKKWEAEAKIQRKAQILSTAHTKAERPDIIARGFRACIAVEKKTRSGEKRSYFVPCFMVKIIGEGKPNKCFRVNKLGLKNAYLSAAKFYSSIHKLSANQRLELVAKLPERDLFSDYLLKKINSRGYSYSQEALDIVLDV